MTQMPRQVYGKYCREKPDIRCERCRTKLWKKSVMPEWGAWYVKAHRFIDGKHVCRNGGSCDRRLRERDTHTEVSVAP